MARVEKIGEEAVAVKGIIIEILHGALSLIEGFRMTQLQNVILSGAKNLGLTLPCAIDLTILHRWRRRE